MLDDSAIIDTRALSPMQKSILLASSYRDSASSYNVQVITRLGEELDIATLEKAWSLFFSQIEHFRVAVRRASGSNDYEAAIYHESNAFIEQLDFTSLAIRNRKLAWSSFLVDDLGTRFDLNKPPLIRATLAKFSDKHYRLVITFHHILFDGNSFSKVFLELMNCYDALRKGQDYEIKPCSYPPAPIPQPLAPESVEYWRETLSDYSNTMKLCISKQLLSSSANHTEFVYKLVNSELYKKIRKVSRQLKVTPNIIFEAAWAYLLSKYTYSNDVIISSIRSIAPKDEIGLFVKALPLRCEFSDLSLTVADFIAAIRSQHKAFSQYKSTAFEEVVKKINFDFSSIKVGVDYKTSSPQILMKEFGDQEAWKRRTGYYNTDTHYDLFLDVFKEGEGFFLKLNFKSDLYARKHVEDLLTQLVFLLDVFASDVTGKLSKISLLDNLADEAKNAMLNTGKKSAYPFSNLIFDITQNVNFSPTKTVIVDSYTKLDYATLNRYSAMLSSKLTKAGVKPGDVLLIRMNRSIDMVISLLAVIKLGGIYLPVDPDIPQERLDYILKDANVKFALEDSTYARKNFASPAVTRINVDSLGFKEDRGSNISFSSYNKDQVAYVIYTSGSTGQPKGVKVSHLALLNLLVSARDKLNIHSSDVFLAHTSIGFDISGLEIYLPLVSGAKLVIVEKDECRDPFKIKSFLDTQKITVLQATPSMLQMLLDIGWENNGLVKVLCGGEPLSREVALRLLSKGHGFWHCYGPTETTIWSAITYISSIDDAPWVPFGEPTFNTSLFVLDRQFQQLPPGIVGEIYISGSGLAEGYVDSEKTEQAFLEIDIDGRNKRLYKTGDLACWREDGLLEFKGRVDNQIKMRGYRIEIFEIEYAIQKIEGVIACGVLPKLHNNKVQYLVAYVQCNQTLTHNILKEKLLTQIPEYMIPTKIHFLEQLPVNSSGKLDRARLKLWMERNKDSVAPLVENLTARLRSLFSDVLKINLNELNDDDDFFALGGDSLSLYTLIMRIESLFNVRLSMQTIRAYSTVEALSAYIQNIDRDQIKRSLSIDVDDKKVSASLPLSDFQNRLWLLGKFEDVDNYRMSLFIRLDGFLNMSAIRKSLQVIAERHDALRIRIVENADRIYQEINKDFHFNDVFSFEKITEDESIIENDVPQFMKNVARKLPRDQMFHAKIISLSDELHYLLIFAHHIIFDEWSANLFMSELSSLYNGFVNDKPASLPKLESSLLDYISKNILWNNKKPEEFNQELSFWKSYLDGFEKLHFTYSNSKAVVKSFEVERVSFELSESICSQINSFVRDKKITLATLLLTAVNCLLSKYTCSNDIIVGVPATMRKTAGSEHLIGPFISAIPVRLKFSNTDTFSDLLAKVYDSLLQANMHVPFPIEKAIEVLELNADVSENPIFQTLFALRKDTHDYLSLEGVQASMFIEPMRKSAIHLGFYFLESSQSIKVNFDYRKDLLNAGFVERMRDSFSLILQDIISGSTQPFVSYDVLSESHSKQLALLNDTSKDYDGSSCIDRMDQSAVKFPKKVAVKDDVDELTYEDLRNRTNDLASFLLAQEFAHETLVGVCLDKTVSLPVVVLSIVKAGLAYVPLDLTYPQKRIKYFIERSHLSVIFCDDRTLAFVEEILSSIDYDITVFNISTLDVNSSKKTSLPSISNNSLAYVIYTSGSSGMPKGVAVEHGSLNNFSNAMEVLGIDSGDRLLSVSPISFDVFNLELFLTLKQGATLIFSNNHTTLNPQHVKDLIFRESINVIQATPTFWQALIESGWKNDDFFKVICGGDILSLDLASSLLSEGNGFWHCYGPTETTIWSSCDYIQSIDGKDEVSIGSPISNTQIFILDKNLHQVPIGVEGEIYIAGAGLARGYWQDARATSKVFVEIDIHGQTMRAYKTGDKGLWNTQGQLIFRGRVSRELKLNGYRIGVEEIESCLIQHESIQDAAVTLTKEKDDYLTAFLVPSGGSVKHVDFSLFFFPSDQLSSLVDPYDLYFSATKFADRHGFKAIWTPERHFDKVGGQFPNPTVLTSALSQVTEQIELRSGSLVIPLHNPIRVAEDWSVLDNLSEGRVGMALASGWHPQDFVLNPGAYEKRKQLLSQSVETLRELWSGGTVSLADGENNQRNITIYPKPLQKELPLWITAAEDIDTFRLAGKLGCNLLTHLLGQSLDELSEKIDVYRSTLEKNGFDPDSKTVTLAVHTYLEEPHEGAVNRVRPYFKGYLKSHMSLLLKFTESDSVNLNDLPERDLEDLLDYAVDRLLLNHSLIGSREHSYDFLTKIISIGVDEISCLIDFGLSKDLVMSSLMLLSELKAEVRERRSVEFAKIKSYLATQLPYYMLPKKFVLLDKIPQGNNGKKDRKQLEKIRPALSRKRQLFPKTALEKQLILMIENYYHAKNVSLEMNLHDLGGSSLIVVQLVSSIKKKFGVELTIRDIFELPDISHLVQLIKNSQDKNIDTILEDSKVNPIVLLRKGGSQAPLFLIHPVGGTVYCYRYLVDHLPKDRTIYGIEDPGIHRNEKLFYSFDDMVKFYVNSIRNLEETNKVCLAGASMGGTLALEIAAQLRKFGIDCQLVGLLDTWAVFPEDLKRKSYFEANMKRQHELMSKAFDNYDIDDADKWLELQWDRQRLLMEYRPREVDNLNVVLFKADELLPEYQLIDEPTNYWSEYLGDSLEIVSVPGTHESIFAEKNARHLADQLSMALVHKELAENVS